MNGFSILVIFVIAISIIRSMGIQFINDKKNTVFHKICAYLISYAVVAVVLFAFFSEIANYTLKTIYFDPTVTNDKFYRDTYNVWYWFIIVALFAVAFALCFKKTLELARKNPIFLWRVAIENYGIIVIAYFIIETAAVIILPDSVTENVRTMHILKGTVFIPITAILYAFFFRYNVRRLKKSIKEWDNYKKRVEDNLKKRNQK